jgi:hypothetical protein
MPQPSFTSGTSTVMSKNVVRFCVNIYSTMHNKKYLPFILNPGGV